MFDDEELKSIIRYIDLYHEAVSEATRSRAIEFLTSKLQDKVPGVTKHKTIEIMKEFHPDLFGITDDNTDDDTDDKDYYTCDGNYHQNESYTPASGFWLPAFGSSFRLLLLASSFWLPGPGCSYWVRFLASGFQPGASGFWLPPADF